MRRMPLLWKLILLEKNFNSGTIPFFSSQRSIYSPGEGKLESSGVQYTAKFKTVNNKSKFRQIYYIMVQIPSKI